MAKEDDAGVSNKQAFIYLGIVVVCFGLLYPRILHPMVKVILGLNEAPKTTETAELPPHLRQSVPVRTGVDGHKPSARPPPGARRDQGGGAQADTGGSKGGVIGMVLPVYAIGIVIYLLYTAVKVYGGDTKGSKKKKSGKAEDDVYSMITERLANIDLDKVLSGEDVKGAEEINKLAEYLREKQEKRSDSGKAVGGDSYRDACNSDVVDPGNVPVAGDELDITGDPQNMDPEHLRQLQAQLVAMEEKMSKIMGVLKSANVKASVAEEKQIALDNSSDDAQGNSDDGCRKFAEREARAHQSIELNHLIDDNCNEDDAKHDDDEDDDDGKIQRLQDEGMRHAQAFLHHHVEQLGSVESSDDDDDDDYDDDDADDAARVSDGDTVDRGGLRRRLMSTK